MLAHVIPHNMKNRNLNYLMMAVLIAVPVVVYAGIQPVCACGFDKKPAYEVWLSRLAQLVF
jgi:hypothetical protein